MKFTCTVDIDLSLSKVIELWDSNENLKHWQTGFVRYEETSGTPGEVGSKTTYWYKQGKNEMEIEETILVNDLPKEFTGLYEHKHMSNTMKNTFEVLDENKTRWNAEIQYTIFNGFFIKVISALFPSMFRKQTQKWLDQFKAFAEENAVNS